MLRPLRALRGVLAVSIIARRGRSFARGRVVAYVAGAVALVAFIAALAMLDAERGEPDATVATFGDALWWAATTVTTVGYGDYFPSTTEGRLVAVGLMVTGIALLGVITAALASWFVEKVGEVQAAEQRTGSRSPSCWPRCGRCALTSRNCAGTVGAHSAVGLTTNAGPLTTVWRKATGFRICESQLPF